MKKFKKLALTLTPIAIAPIAIVACGQVENNINSNDIESLKTNAVKIENTKAIKMVEYFEQVKQLADEMATKYLDEQKPNDQYHKINNLGNIRELDQLWNDVINSRDKAKNAIQKMIDIKEEINKEFETIKYPKGKSDFGKKWKPYLDTIDLAQKKLLKINEIRNTIIARIEVLKNIN